MKLTRSWLENYIEIPYSTEEMCHHLTMAGLEVDEIIELENDFLIDIDLTPNRSDCLSVYGIARELNCINKKYKLKSKKNNNVFKVKSKNTDKKFIINKTDLCPKYGYMYLENISLSCKTPNHIEKKLDDIGIKTIHPIVDILNFIMIDTGQPMHAYDADKIGDTIFVKHSKNGEVLNALDGNEYKLQENNLIITDSKKIISLAGIIGAENCSVKSSTKSILIECAFFMPEALANKARKLKIQTESSQRYERGVDYNLTEIALKKLQTILHENSICDFSDFNILEEKDYIPKQNKVEINNEMIRKTIGLNLDDEEISEILLSIGCEFDKKSNTVLNPSYRYDLNIHADYIEEVSRIYGYDNIPAESEKISVDVNKSYTPFKVINEIKQFLYANSYSECINYSFVNDSSMENLDWKNQEFTDHCKIENYMSIEQNKLRSNLVSSLINNIEYNYNANLENSYRVYEISTLFGKKIEQVLTCVVYGNKEDENWAAKKQKFDKYDMTTICEEIAKLFGLKKSDLDYVIRDLFFNKKSYITFSLSISDLIEKIKQSKAEEFVEYSRLPYIRRDLSFLIDESIAYENILKVIEKIHVHSLKKILLFDLYEGKNVPDHKKSLGMGFIFQDKDKTLTHEDADRKIEVILKSLEEKFKVILRK